MFDSASVAPESAVIDTAAFCRSMFCFCATTVIDSSASKSAAPAVAVVSAVGAGPAMPTWGAALPMMNSVVATVRIPRHVGIARSSNCELSGPYCKNRAQWLRRSRKTLSRAERSRGGAFSATRRGHKSFICIRNFPHSTATHAIPWLTGWRTRRRDSPHQFCTQHALLLYTEPKCRPQGRDRPRSAAAAVVSLDDDAWAKSTDPVFHGAAGGMPVRDGMVAGGTHGDRSNGL